LYVLAGLLIIARTLNQQGKRFAAGIKLDKAGSQLPTFDIKEKSPFCPVK
jgi:hypothetical protein